MYLLSKENVIIPTNVRVETNAPTWAKPAPFWRRVLQVEKATNVGIIVIEPIADDKNTPKNPEESPIKFDIVSGFTIAKINETINIILKNWGIIFSKDLSEIFRAFFVLFLSLKNEIINKTMAKVYKIKAVIKSPLKIYKTLWL